MNKKDLYIVHIHYIESSYSFGAFDSVEILTKSIKDFLNKDDEHDCSHESMKEVYNIPLNVEYCLYIESNCYGWGICFTILHQCVNDVFGGTEADLLGKEKS